MSKMLAPGRRVPALAPFGACRVCGPGIRVFKVDGERRVRCRGCGLTVSTERRKRNRIGRMEQD